MFPGTKGSVCENACFFLGLYFNLAHCGKQADKFFTSMHLERTQTQVKVNYHQHFRRQKAYQEKLSL